MERSHRVFKASLKGSGDRLLSVPLLPFVIRAMPNKDSIYPFLPVTGKASLFPQGLLPTLPSRVITDVHFIKKFVCRVNELDYRIPPILHSNFTSYVPKSLFSCLYANFRKPLEAPYQGPFEVISHNPKCFMILPSRNSIIVSIARLKPDVLPSNTPTPPAAVFTELQPTVLLDPVLVTHLQPPPHTHPIPILLRVFLSLRLLRNLPLLKHYLHHI